VTVDTSKIIGIGHSQHQGARDYQEDSFSVSELGKDKYLLALADGMGGHVGGARASEIAVEAALSPLPEMPEDEDQTVENQASAADALTQRMRIANSAISACLEAEPELEGMGCTLVLLSVSSRGYQFSSVGDSPLWLLRNDELVRMNADHSMAPVLEDMVLAGRITPEEAKVDPRRNALRSALTGEDIDLLDVSEEIIGAEPGDIFLLASDGLETLNQGQIIDILKRSEENASEKCARLITAVLAEETENQDNVSVMVMKYDDLYGSDFATVATAAPEVMENLELEEAVTKPLARPSHQVKMESKKSKKPALIFCALLLLLLIILTFLFRSEIGSA